RSVTGPCGIGGSKESPRGRGIDPGGAVIAYSSAMNDRVHTAVLHRIVQQMLQVVKGPVRVEIPAFSAERHPSPQFLDHLRMRREQGHAMASRVAVQRDACASLAGKNVGDAANSINGSERVAGGNKDVHALIVSG